MLLDLPETFGIYSGLLAGNGQWLESQGSAWATFRGTPLIPGTVPDELIQKGVAEIRDTLKVIASTDECDATLLDQPDLEVPFEPSRGSGKGFSLHRHGGNHTLATLMSRVQTRHFAPEPDTFVDWTTAQQTITITGPP